MLKIEITIEKPWQTLFLAVALIACGIWFVSSGGQPNGIGGPDAELAVHAHLLEDDVRSLRTEQQVLAHREEILRLQVERLEYAWQQGQISLEHFKNARAELLTLSKDRIRAEQKLKVALTELWEAQSAARIASTGRGDIEAIEFVWPVPKSNGVTAHFLDTSYEKTIGMKHYAVDIRSAQGSPVRSAADGIVTDISENGYGFNSLTISHGDGIATLYGHVSRFLVAEGDIVNAGQLVALSGGEPGTPGAGNLTTGPHLHFELWVNGEQIDPEKYLP